MQLWTKHAPLNIDYIINEGKSSCVLTIMFPIFFALRVSLIFDT